jgi:hypothetical protein
MIRRSNFQIGAILRSTMFLVFFSTMANPGSSQSIPKDSLFLGQKTPQGKPEIFPLFVNKGFFAAERIAITNDGKEILYSEIKGYYPIKGENIKRYIYTDGKWKGPFDLFDGYAPALSVTGDTLYFERKDLTNNSEAYLSVKTEQGWSNPKRILTVLVKAHYCQITGKGNYYISTKSENSIGLNDWSRVVINGPDTTAVSLGKPLNTPWENLDFFVSRDESYMIVTNRPRLGISYKNEDGSWTNPINFGPKIDFGLGSWGPYVSPDNKYLFFTTGTKPDYSDVYVYWVRIDGVIDSLKNTNPDSGIKPLIKN